MTKNKVISKISLVLVQANIFLVPANIFLQKKHWVELLKYFTITRNLVLHGLGYDLHTKFGFTP